MGRSGAGAAVAADQFRYRPERRRGPGAWLERPELFGSKRPAEPDVVIAEQFDGAEVEIDAHFVDWQQTKAAQQFEDDEAEAVCNGIDEEALKLPNDSRCVAYFQSLAGGPCDSNVFGIQISKICGNLHGASVLLRGL
jgi:hypothetical protein